MRSSRRGSRFPIIIPECPEGRAPRSRFHTPPPPGTPPPPALAPLRRYHVSHDSHQEPVMPERLPPPLSPPVYHVLLAIGGETLHGYAIMQRFEELMEGAEQILPGTLYATLGRMVEHGLIEETRAPRGEESGG